MQDEFENGKHAGMRKTLPCLEEDGVWGMSCMLLDVVFIERDAVYARMMARSDPTARVER